MTSDRQTQEPVPDEGSWSPSLYWMSEGWGQEHSQGSINWNGRRKMGFIIQPHVCLPSVYLMWSQVTKSPRPFPSIFVYCKRSNSGGRNGLGKRANCKHWHKSVTTHTICISLRTTWSLHGHYMVTTWSLRGHYMVTTWSLHGWRLIATSNEKADGWAWEWQLHYNFLTWSIKFNIATIS